MSAGTGFTPYSLALVWLRRDLRLHDHAALQQALRLSRRVVLCFVYDTEILDPLLQQGLQADRRLGFIAASLSEVDEALRARGSALLVEHGAAPRCIAALAARLGAGAVFVNRDGEPAALRRDAEAARLLAEQGVRWHAEDDQLMLPPQALRTGQGRPYTVFTPYRRAWLARMQADGAAALRERECSGLDAQWLSLPEAPPLPRPEDVGFSPAALPAGVHPGMRGARACWDSFAPKMEHYAQVRDIPALDGTSGLSVHLRFGTISVREPARLAWERMQQGCAGAAAWLSELIWRDFFGQILYHHPQVVDGPFRPECARIGWNDAPAWLAAWRDGRTGYPLVDAAMRELRASGRMHNRLRMVVASFLSKDLGLDWRLGEAHFARELLDFDLASNNGGWQWAASTGCDAQPWFRIFNPVQQSRKFDPDGRYILRHVPELAGLPAAHLHAPWLAPAPVLQAAGVEIGRTYPAPLVDHAAARDSTLRRYGAIRGG